MSDEPQVLSHFRAPEPLDAINPSHPEHEGFRDHLQMALLLSPLGDGDPVLVAAAVIEFLRTYGQDTND